MLTVFDADPTLKNKEQQTALDIATEHQDAYTQALLGSPIVIPTAEENDDEKAEEIETIEIETVAIETQDQAVQTPIFEEAEELEMNEPEPEPFDTKQADAEWTLTRGALISHKWSTRRLLLPHSAPAAVPAEVMENKETEPESGSVRFSIKITPDTSVADTDAEAEDQFEDGKKEWFMEHYKSEKEMLDDEKIDSLSHARLTVTSQKIFKDPKKILNLLPRAQVDRFHIERDLRKLKIGLLRIHDPQPRKLAKLSSFQIEKIASFSAGQNVLSFSY